MIRKTNHIFFIKLKVISTVLNVSKPMYSLLKKTSSIIKNSQLFMKNHSTSAFGLKPPRILYTKPLSTKQTNAPAHHFITKSIANHTEDKCLVSDRYT